MSADDQSDLEIIHSVASKFIIGAFPEEEPFLPVIWRCFTDEWSAIEQHSASGDLLVVLREIGLGLDRSELPPLVGPYAVATAAAVWFELKDRKISPDVDLVAKAVTAAAKAYGAPRDVTAKMAERMGPMLARAFTSMDWPAPESAALELGESAGLVTSTDKVYLYILREGKCNRDPIEMDYGKAEQAASDEKFTLVVNERLGRVILPLHIELRGGRKTQTVAIVELSPAKRRILWLILAFVGQGFSHDHIVKLRPKSKANDRGWIYQYPVELGKLIGPGLKSKILETGSVHSWSVEVDGWSFCWILNQPDKQRSALLAGIEER